jgi:NAD(P)-dependent dehydrogenase (short-subunit alcohol dehydrogenase family)
MPEPAAPSLDLSGRSAVVTGASRGLGSAIAMGLAAAGARVIGISRSGGQTAPRVTHLQHDLSDIAALPSLFAQIRKDLSSLDILVNAAAISLPAPNPADFGGEIDRMRRTIEVDLIAAYGAVLAARSLFSARGASIINVTSINSVRGFPANPAYVSAKAALAGLTRALAVDLAADRIRVNAIAPGYFRTAMTEQSFNDPEKNAARSAQTILGRWGEAQDIVGTAVFLASDASAYITGQEIFVDGGWTANGLVARDKSGR